MGKLCLYAGGGRRRGAGLDRNERGKSIERAEQVRLVTTIENMGVEAGTADTEERIATGADHVFAQQVAISNPKLWCTEEPTLDTAAACRAAPNRSPPATAPSWI